MDGLKDLLLSDILDMQMKLWEKHRDTWSPMEPAYARNSLLWLVDELGEVIAIIKKKGETAIMRDDTVRRAFIEEMGDVLMYFCDALLRCGVTAEEFATIYAQKHARNMGRDFTAENARFLSCDE